MSEKLSIVGYTGFVGSNICKNKEFTNYYNSKNFEEAFGTNPDLLVYSGVRAEKFVSNANPEDDYNHILQTYENIVKINPKKLVLISTVDVYSNPQNVDETTVIDENEQAYGRNRLILEKMLSEKFENITVIRLPALFGINLKKNFIYDIIKFIPAKLIEAKYNELVEKQPKIQEFYSVDSNGFYCVKNLDAHEEIELKGYFNELGFSALNFTDSRASFQFYNLDNLWNDIEIAIQNNLTLLNVATEPITASEIYTMIFNSEFKNELNKPVANYDFKTIHYKLFNGENGYMYNKTNLLNEIKEFVETYSVEV